MEYWIPSFTAYKSRAKTTSLETLPVLSISFVSVYWKRVYRNCFVDWTVNECRISSNERYSSVTDFQLRFSPDIFSDFYIFYTVYNSSRSVTFYAFLHFKTIP